MTNAEAHECWLRSLPPTTRALFERYQREAAERIAAQRAEHASTMPHREAVRRARTAIATIPGATVARGALTSSEDHA